MAASLRSPSEERHEFESGASLSNKGKRRALQQADINLSADRSIRSYVSRACDFCKRKRVRCDGYRPCGVCTRRKLCCRYESSHSRGRPRSPPSRYTTEATIHEIDGYRSAANKGAEKGSSAEEQTLGQPRSTLCASSDEIGSGMLAQDQDFDPTSGFTFLRRAWRRAFKEQQSEISSDVTPGFGNSTAQSQLLTSAGDNPFRVDLQFTSNNMPDMTGATELVGYYFDNCVATYQILHRQDFESEYLEPILLESSDIYTVLGNAKAAILLGIMAISSLRKEKVRGSFDEDQALQTSDHYFCASMYLTETETGYPKLESTQARLLQVLYLLQTSRMNKAWYICGTVFNIITSLGLHRKHGQSRVFDLHYTSETRTYIAAQSGRRAFWVAYTIDQYLSVVLGRPKMYHDEDIDQEFPESMNDGDVAQQGLLGSDSMCESLVDGLIAHAKIAQIIGRISQKVYTIKNVPLQERITAAHALMKNIHEWRDCLPTHLYSVKPATLMPAYQRQSLGLKLAYAHAILHASRPFLLGDLGNFINNSTLSLWLSESISAAQLALETVDRMACDSEIFHTFWWMHYVTFCAIVVVYMWEILLHSSERPAYLQANDIESAFNLAERCRLHLSRASLAAASSSRRYGIILEELLLEAQRRMQLRDNSPSSVGDALSGAGDMTVILNAWQPSDWLDLDSSVGLKIDSQRR